jgi:hexosaminidase
LVLHSPIDGQCKTLWPLPVMMTTGNGVLGVSANSFTIVSSSQSSVLQAAIARYQSTILFPFSGSKEPSGGSVLTQLNITVESDSQDLQLYANETYSLTIASGASVVARLQAATIFGAMRGLESFSQLIDFDATAMTYSMTQAPVSITDYPRFAWRGLLIDSARHYLSIDTIYRTIDAMSYSKLNTLHWHAVDAESFPVEIDAYPLLSAKGAYAATATYDSNDIKDVVQYALQRGIRVVMEFDMPGHAYSWGLGYANLTAVCPNYASNINNIPLDPTQDFTYSVISAIVSQMASLTPDNCMHIGGDEVITGCWMQDAAITAWMKQHGMSSATQLLQYFENQVAPIMSSINRTSVVWEDLFDSGISLSTAKTIIEVWDEPSSLNSIIKAGYKAITAYGWYVSKAMSMAMSMAMAMAMRFTQQCSAILHDSLRHTT